MALHVLESATVEPGTARARSSADTFNPLDPSRERVHHTPLPVDWNRTKVPDDQSVCSVVWWFGHPFSARKPSCAKIRPLAGSAAAVRTADRLRASAEVRCRASYSSRRCRGARAPRRRNLVVAPPNLAPVVGFIVSCPDGWRDCRRVRRTGRKSSRRRRSKPTFARTASRRGKRRYSSPSRSRRCLASRSRPVSCAIRPISMALPPLKRCIRSGPSSRLNSGESPLS